MSFNILDFFAQFLPKPKESPWTPTYEVQQYVRSLNGPYVPVNIFYFATQETAEHLKQKYGASSISLEPFEGSGGAVSQTDLKERHLVWPNGVKINAGILASLWTLNGAYPDTANSLTLAAIAARGAR